MPNCGGIFDIDAKRAKLTALESRMTAPDFWNDQDRAQKLLKQRSRLQAAIDKAEQFQRDVEDAAVLLEFAAQDESSLSELQTVTQRLEHEVEEAETEENRRRLTCEYRTARTRPAGPPEYLSLRAWQDD